MQLVEQHVIKRSDPRFAVVDAAAFQSKNLSHASRYEVRQSYLHEGIYLNYYEMQRLMPSHEAYTALPAKVSQQVAMLLHHEWESFFQVRAAYEEAPSKFTGRPKLPTDTQTTEGRTVLVDTLPVLSNGTTGRAGSRQA